MDANFHTENQCRLHCKSETICWPSASLPEWGAEQTWLASHKTFTRISFFWFSQVLTNTIRYLWLGSATRPWAVAYSTNNFFFISMAWGVFETFWPAAAGKHKSLWKPKFWGLKHSQILTQLPGSTVQNNWALNWCSWCQDLQFGLFGPYINKTPTGLNPTFLVPFCYGVYYWFSLYFLFVLQLNSWPKTLHVLDPHNCKSHRCTFFYTTPAKTIMKIYLLGNKI